MSDADKKSASSLIKENQAFTEEAEKAGSNINKLCLVSAITFIAGVTFAIFTGGEDD